MLAVGTKMTDPKSKLYTKELVKDIDLNVRRMLMQNAMCFATGKPRPKFVSKKTATSVYR
jgi:hypothetical protein